MRSATNCERANLQPDTRPVGVTVDDAPADPVAIAGLRRPHFHRRRGLRRREVSLGFTAEHPSRNELRG